MYIVFGLNNSAMRKRFDNPEAMGKAIATFLRQNPGATIKVQLYARVWRNSDWNWDYLSSTDVRSWRSFS